MLKNFLKNRKGTAEVIGSVMFIVILLFFFTNVYLWHDAATKEMNDLYVEKINSPITLEVVSANPLTLNVTNKGGVGATLTRVWVDNKTLTGFSDHIYLSDNKYIEPGGSVVVYFNNYVPANPVAIKVITTVGNSAGGNYP
jgi:hypothetical protein